MCLIWVNACVRIVLDIVYYRSFCTIVIGQGQMRLVLCLLIISLSFLLYRSRCSTSPIIGGRPSYYYQSSNYYSISMYIQLSSQSISFYYYIACHLLFYCNSLYYYYYFISSSLILCCYYFIIQSTFCCCCGYFLNLSNLSI